MNYSKRLSSASAAVLMALCGEAFAQDLPKSGSINIHTGWQITPVVFEAPDKRSVGHGSVVGINFNGVPPRRVLYDARSALTTSFPDELHPGAFFA